MIYLEAAILLFVITAVVLLAMLIKKVASVKQDDSLIKSLRAENESLRTMITQQNSDMRREIGDSVKNSMDSFGGLMRDSLKSFSEAQNAANESESRQLYDMRRSMENNLYSIREENSKKLEQMRETVDEKLSQTLEKRLTESFESVSKQLESVYKGLGEMQTLASSVGDLKNALTNVKVRGTWGEVSLDSLLSQVLSPEQYEKNVKPVPRSSNIVEFCIRLPNNDNNDIVYLPIDCKFPIEQYLRLCDASEKRDASAVDEAGKQLEASIKLSARTIRDKYIAPPYTTDFAIMYLPIEGLYAEVARRSGLCELLQREYRVTVAGPTTIGAFLNSLQLGFKTLAIQRRTSEITKLLTRIRDNFQKFAGLLEKTSDKLDDAKKNIDLAAKRYGMIDALLDKADTLAPPGDTGMPALDVPEE